ncbi:MAG: manganese efflux pump MntP family protein [Firmicutes bacterium]|nr:manganese efflux pump MntP family protein [Bacillota bacterium]
MTLFEIVFLAAALSMDAFSVALASGLGKRTAGCADAFKMAFFFGLFQFIMPVIGSGATLFFVDFANKYSDFIVFVILVFLGARMIIEKTKEDEIPKNAFSLPSLLLLAFATSIDALAAGITLGAAEAPILFSSAVIGVTAFAFSYSGVIIGANAKIPKLERADVIGGIMLILLGLRSLLSVIVRIAQR